MNMGLFAIGTFMVAVAIMIASNKEKQDFAIFLGGVASIVLWLSGSETVFSDIREAGYAIEYPPRGGVRIGLMAPTPTTGPTATPRWLDRP